MIKEYDKVRLITGEVARISEVLGNGSVYVAEILKNGTVTVEQIEKKDIAAIFVESEQPISQVM